MSLQRSPENKSSPKPGVSHDDVAAGSAKTEEYLYGRINYERSREDRSNSQDFRFETIQQLLQYRDNPHLKYPVIHVAGTKGKGSVVAMIASILQAAGYRAGVYSSPHLEAIHERIVVDHSPIAPDAFNALIESFHRDVAKIDQAVTHRPELHPPTFFEIMTAAAFDYFAARKVDAAVIEVGMGGRLDSTNVCQPVVTVITNIGLDHQRILGATRTLIAAEKAGIIKRGIPLVCGVSGGKPAEVIATVARTLDAPTFWYGRDFRCSMEPGTRKQDDANLFHTWGEVGQPYELKRCSTRLIGRHQAINAGIAVAVTRWLTAQGWSIDESATRRGLAQAQIPGRFQILGNKPTVVLDIAHNEISIAAFAQTLAERFDNTPRGKTLIFAASRDKRIARMLTRLLPHFDRVIVTKFLGNPRATEPTSLRLSIERIVANDGDPTRSGPSVELAADPQLAWAAATDPGRIPETIVITGSVFLVGEMLPIVRNYLRAVACA